MMVIVDTSVLSLAFRRRDANSLSLHESRIVETLRRLAKMQIAVLIGMVRQEALTGIRSEKQFSQLQLLFDGFETVVTEKSDHDSAAECANKCRGKGIASDPVDMLVCATAIRHRAMILTVDGDFQRYSRHLPVTLYQVR